MKNTKKNLLITVILVAVVAIAITVGALFTVSAATINTTLDIAYANLSFDNEVHLLYATESTSKGLKLLVWTSYQDDYTYGTQAAVVTESTQMDIDGITHTVFKYTGVSAKNMADVLYTRVYDGTNYGDVNKYSILQYAYNKLGKTGIASTNDDFKAMLEGMLDYGALTQTYFGYKTDRLSNAAWVQIKTEGGSLSDGFNKGLYLPGDEITLIAPPTNAEDMTFVYWKNSAGIIVADTATATQIVSDANETYTAEYASYAQGLSFVSNGDGTCSVSGIGTCTETDIKIPPISPDGDTVTSIGISAFANETSLMSVSLPASIETIGHSAFSGCTSLSSIAIPENVKSIEYRTFYQCAALNDVVMADNVNTIAAQAFYGCTALQQVSMPEELKYIYTKAFYGCTALKSITIPGNVVLIDYYAFTGSGLTNAYVEAPYRWTEDCENGTGTLEGGFSFVSVDPSVSSTSYAATWLKKTYTNLGRTYGYKFYK